MDEARRYLEGGHPEQLRLALLILDNAAELQLDRRTEHELTSERLNERIRERALGIQSDERPESLRELTEWQP